MIGPHHSVKEFSYSWKP